jgi:hypothetical protein
MELTLEEAAVKLGKSPRQVRYLIKSERVPARKVAGRWFVNLAELPQSDGQAQAESRKTRQLRAAVEEALELPSEPPTTRRYSVRDLKAFQIALPLFRTAETALGAEHAATRELRSVLDELARGCHRYDRGEKAAAYRAARDAASLAVCQCLLAATPEADTLVQAIEQELMAALAGLLRRLERRRT